MEEKVQGMKGGKGRMVFPGEQNTRTPWNELKSAGLHLLLSFTDTLTANPEFTPGHPVSHGWSHKKGVTSTPATGVCNPLPVTASSIQQLRHRQRHKLSASVPCPVVCSPHLSLAESNKKPTGQGAGQMRFANW